MASADAIALRDEMSAALDERLAKLKAVERRANPFSYEVEKLDAYGVVKYLIGGLVLLPVRVVLIVVSGLLISLWMRITVIGQPQNKPPHPFRRFLQTPVKLFPRWLLFVMGFYRVRVKGKLSKASKARVVVGAPHSTAADGAVLTWILGNPSAVAKAELLSNPFMAPMLRASQAIMVDRHTKEGKAASLAEIERRAKSKENYPRIILFPEGTCTNRRSLIAFKRGAFTSGQPVQPVVLEWPWTHFDPSWTSGANRTRLVFKLLMQYKNSVSATILPAYEPNEEEQKDFGLYSENVRAKMAEALKIGTSEHSYEDSFLAKLAFKLDVNVEECLPYEFKALKHDVCNGVLDLKTAKAKLRRFAALDKMKERGGGQERAALAGFAKLLGVPLSDPVAELYAALSKNDTSGDGMDYTSFLVGTTALSDDLQERACRMIFDMVDTDKAGEISVQALSAALNAVFWRDEASVGHKKVTKLPFLKQARLNETGGLTYDHFRKLMSDHQEYLMLAVAVVALPSRELRPLSATAAQLVASQAMK